MEKRKLFWTERIQQLCLILLVLLWFWKGEISMFRHFTYGSDYGFHNFQKIQFYTATSLFVCTFASLLIYFIEKQINKRLTRLFLFLIPLVYIFLSTMGIASQAFTERPGDYSMFILAGIPLVALIHLAQTINDNKEFALLKRQKGGAVLRIESLMFISLSLYIFGLEFLLPISIIGAFLSLLGVSAMFLFLLPLSLYSLFGFYLLIAWQKLRRNMQVRAWIYLLSGLSFVISLMIALVLLPDLIAIYFGLMAVLSLATFIAQSISDIKRGHLQ